MEWKFPLRSAPSFNPNLTLTGMLLHFSIHLTISLAMSTSLQTHRQHPQPRQRKGPPVPPKHYTKPLPPAPILNPSVEKALPPKPLPLPPTQTALTSSLRGTLLWAAAFLIWFLAVVVLLPVVTERDAMPGFNRWLRDMMHRMLGSSG
ncbi:hypothetical protein BDV96DRAFT_642847 [Lophiotrema nucula]|uniref:Uncharacterized protein n=1 Tax=Lophiotrema nucula TaxID=690887 RepID=A0A6A5ZHW5_9PLEO|nr:hypothetical protein BDV96DRAFT_642847 [Lophiotrema nucula]